MARYILKSLLLKHGETEAQQQKICSDPSSVQGALAGDALGQLLQNVRSVNSFFSSLLLQLYMQRNANKLLKQVDCFLNVFFYPCIYTTEIGLL